ncbi:MAG: oligosaccharide flippase family protein [Spirochaetales bacterium]|nr:oligosaccharide flippase family protein [Spirochaetales bacterium]
MKNKLKNSKIFEATSFTFLGMIFMYFLRLGSNLILTRLLTPEYFGIISIGSVFLTALNLFSDLGINPSIIRSKRHDDQVFLNTAWTINAGRGVIIFLLTIVIAYPVSLFYDEKILFALLPLLGINAFVSGFYSTSIAILKKKLDQKRLVISEAVITTISISVMVVVAYFTRSIFSLIVNGFLHSILMLLWSHKINDFKHKFVFEKEAFQEIMNFGKWIFLSTAMFFLASQLDKVLLGKYLGMTFFGIYNIAIVFAELPKNIIERLNGSVIFPSISNLKKEEIIDKIRRPRKILLLLTVAGLAVFASFSDYLIILLYDDRYSQAAWMLPILTLGIWPRILVVSLEGCLLTVGKPKYLAGGNFFKVIYMLICIPLAYHLWGILGTVVVVVLNDIPLYTIMLIGLIREKMSLLRQDILLSGLLVILILFFMVIRHLLGLGLPGAEYYVVS